MFKASKAGSEPALYPSQSGLTVGIRVMTPDGEALVEDLRPGQPIVTRERGTVRVARIMQRDLALSAGSASAPIRIEAEAFGIEKPFAACFLDPAQLIMLRHPLYEAHFDSWEVFVRAGDLVGLPGISQVQGLGWITYFHLTCCGPDMIYAGNLVLALGGARDFADRLLLSGDQARFAVTTVLPHIHRGRGLPFPLQ